MCICDFLPQRICIYSLSPSNSVLPKLFPREELHTPKSLAQLIQNILPTSDGRPTSCDAVSPATVDVGHGSSPKLKLTQPDPRCTCMKGEGSVRLALQPSPVSTVLLRKRHWLRNVKDKACNRPIHEYIDRSGCTFHHVSDDLRTDGIMVQLLIVQPDVVARSQIDSR